eukprot:6962743-Pyramimonas_sp.AAC.1
MPSPSGSACGPSSCAAVPELHDAPSGLPRGLSKQLAASRSALRSASELSRLLLNRCELNDSSPSAARKVDEVEAGI